MPIYLIIFFNSFKLNATTFLKKKNKYIYLYTKIKNIYRKANFYIYQGDDNRIKNNINKRQYVL